MFIVVFLFLGLSLLLVAGAGIAMFATVAFGPESATVDGRVNRQLAAQPAQMIDGRSIAAASLSGRSQRTFSNSSIAVSHGAAAAL